MKLLFDQNLSFDLVRLLASEFPRSTHVRLIGMVDAPDSEIWEFAKLNDYVITSKDKDFYERALIFGAPPKVILLRIGNCATSVALELLRSNLHSIVEFKESDRTTVLVLS